MKASEFEDKVWGLEEIRIVLRCPENHQVEDYDYMTVANQTMSLAEWLNVRVLPKLKDVEVQVISGNGEQPHGRWLLRSIRASYAKG